MIIGTDVSLKECKEQGYTMIKYDGRVKFNHRVSIEIFKYLPADFRKEIRIKGLGNKAYAILDTIELWGEYERRKYEIQSFADYHVESIDEIQSYYDFLTLADVTDAYSGFVRVD